MADANHSVHSDPNKLIGKTVSHYTVQEVLGHGGMGVVYRAEDTHLHRLVALKFQPPTLSQDTRAKERFLVEAQAASALDHPNIGTIYEFGETNTGQLFIAMAYYAGESLRSKLERGPLSSLDALDYGIQIARGLAAAHEAGIVHRDIKPANVVVTDDGLAKIVDFGIARVGDAHLTQTGATAGTTGYMSPEQTRGEEVDGRADIWALGALLYETLTGVRPFRGDYDEAVVYSILHEDPEPMTSVNPAVSANIKVVVERCLQKSPAMRYQDAGELVADLDAVQRGEAPASFSGPSWLKHPRKSILAVAAVALLVVIAGLYVLIKDRGRSFAPLEADPGIAFMPFEVSGPGFEYLREGMVHLLYESLDGAAGLRAISDRTVLAQWDKLVGTEQRADLETAMSVAAAMGARYTLLGSVVAVGPHLRLSGEIYELPDGVSLGRVQAEGSVDSVLALVEDLAVETLRALAQAGVETVPRADLAGVTTHSLPALTAYLEGEAHYRRGEFEASISHFETALDADSTFALAHYRIAGVLLWWGLPYDQPILDYHWSAALHGNLTPRRQLIARVNTLEPERRKDFEDLKDHVRRYPDDGEAWYVLGEWYRHVVLYEDDWIERAKAAFTHAAELDPGFAPYMIHLVEFAFAEYDAGEAGRWVERYRRASPGSDLERSQRITYSLLFESTTDPVTFDAAIDTLAQIVVPGRFHRLVSHPRAASVGMAYSLRRAEETGELDGGICWRYALAEGRWRDFLVYATDPRLEPPGNSPICLLSAYMRDYPVPDELLEKAAEGSTGGTCPECWSGVYAASKGRWGEYERWLTVVREGSERESGVPFLEGYRLWQAGSLEQARETLESAPLSWPAVRWLLGRINLELGRPEVAVLYFSGFFESSAPWTRSLYYLGLAYEDMGEIEKAREAYAEYLDIWKNADPELEPLKQQARDAIIRLQEM